MYRSIALIALLGAAQALTLDTKQCCNMVQHSCCGDADQHDAEHESVEEIMKAILHPEVVIPEIESAVVEKVADKEGSLPNVHIPAVVPAVQAVADMLEDDFADVLENIVATEDVNASIVQGGLDAAIDTTVEMV